MTKTKSNDGGFKLNYKRTMLIGFAFFGILLLWQVYDSWCPTILSELFARAFHPEYASLREINTPEAIDQCGKIIEENQYLVGVMMAIDNLAALILLPIFGRLSDKTRTPIGKRMPYILVGTFVCAVVFPFIPVVFHLVSEPVGSIVGVVLLMAVIVVFSMMYRNPAVSLMPDMTPKPLRSKANGIINIMGYIGGAFATVVGIFFAISEYLGTKTITDNGVKSYAPHTWAYHNIWAIEIPFLLASVLMVVSAVVLFFTVKENEIAAEMKEEMERGEEYSEAVDKVCEDKPLSKANKIMLILILAAEFFWFMADNGIATFMVNYTVYFLGASSAGMMVATIVGGVGSVIGFALGGQIAKKLGRKWTLFSGLGLTLLSYLVWIILTFSIGNLRGAGSVPFWIYIIWAIKGFGMSLVHVNSFPMVVELCPNSKIGRYTGYYYASSMAAQTITPVALGSLLLLPSFSWEFLPVYGGVCLVASIIIFAFVKNVKGDKTKIKTNLLESLDVDE